MKLICVPFCLQRRIENIILIENVNEARRVMEKQVPQNVSEVMGSIP